MDLDVCLYLFLSPFFSIFLPIVSRTTMWLSKIGAVARSRLTFRQIQGLSFPLLAARLQFHYNDVIMGVIAPHITSLTIVLLNRLFRRRSKKTSKLRFTGLCVGNSPETGEFPAQMASNAKNVSIWWRHHVIPEKVKYNAFEMTTATINCDTSLSLFATNVPTCGDHCRIFPEPVIQYKSQNHVSAIYSMH